MPVPDESVQAAIKAAREQAEKVLAAAAAQQTPGGMAADIREALQNAVEALRAGEDELARQGALLEELSRREPLPSAVDRAGAPAASEAVQEIAGLRSTAESLQELLTDLSGHVVAALDGADGVSVTLLTPGSLGATSDAVDAADRMQYALQEGPCYEAMRTGKLQWTDSAHDDPRWPRLAAAFADAGAFRSILGVPLFAGADIVGVLNVYATDAHVFDETTCRIARVLAGPVAATLADARAYTEQSELVAGLRRAVASHRQIGQAIGILMATEGVDADTAFARLRVRSNNTNRKLHEIAEEIVADAQPT